MIFSSIRQYECADERNSYELSNDEPLHLPDPSGGSDLHAAGSCSCSLGSQYGRCPGLSRRHGRNPSGLRDSSCVQPEGAQRLLRKRRTCLRRHQLDRYESSRCLPFFLSGEIPNYVDALFEIVSGFTTTGASILPEVESHSRAVLYWRSFSHWLGGMGVLVFLLAIAPSGGAAGGFTMHLLRAESPGPNVGKLVPRMRETAKILYIMYILLTVVDIFFLLLGNMPLFDAICTAFARPEPAASELRMTASPATVHTFRMYARCSCCSSASTSAAIICC